MQNLSIDIKTMPACHLLLVITCDQTNFTIAVPLRDRTAQTVAEALIYRVKYLFGLLRQIICDEATEFFFSYYPSSTLHAQLQTQSDQSL